MNYIFESEGKSKAEAEEKALQTLGLQASDVTFKPVGPGKGILGLVSRKPTVLRAYPLENTPLDPIIKGTAITVIKKMGFEAEVKSVVHEEENIIVDIASPDSGILIGKRGRTLDALQFIVNLLVHSRLRNSKRIMLDIEGYRDRRQKALTRLAKSVADRVARSGQSVLLEYMNPYERRIIHLSLEEDERVTTRSDGNGLYKRVRVLPAGGDFEDYVDDEEPPYRDDILGNER